MCLVYAQVKFNKTNLTKDKMSKKESNSGTNILTVLFLVFLVFKLTEVGSVANWSWWWVTSPIWIPLAFLIVVYIIAGIAILFDKITKL